MLNRLTRSVFTVLLLTLTAVAAMPTSSYGQTFRGGINGTVADGSGAVVAGASVEAQDYCDRCIAQNHHLERWRVQLSRHAARFLQNHNYRDEF